MNSFVDMIINDSLYEILETLDESEMTVIGNYIISESDSSGCSDALEEALSLLGRRKLAMNMKKNAKKMQKAREHKMARGANKDDILSRARKSAINILRKKMSAGKDVLSISDKERIEKKLSSNNSQIAIDKLARKQYAEFRDLDKKRKQSILNKD